MKYSMFCTVMLMKVYGNDLKAMNDSSKLFIRGAQGWPLFADYFFTYLSLIGILAVILE